MDPGGNKHVPPALPSMMLPGHTSSPPQVPSPLSGGHMPGKAKVRRNHGLPRRAPKANPSINGADFAPSKDRALLIIQGTVQLCKSVDSLCLIAAFYRSGGGGGWGRPEPKLLGARRETPSPQNEKYTPRRWPHRGLCPEPSPTLSLDRRAGRCSEEQLRGLEKKHTHTCCWANNAIIPGFS